MTSEDQINMMLLELKRINSYLEKIDWKLWNLHEIYADPTRSKKDVDYTPPAFTPAKEEPVVKAQLAKESVSVTPVKKPNFSFDIGSVEEVERSIPAIPTIPKYPSIEDL
jgi:hypothetical protein